MEDRYNKKEYRKCPCYDSCPIRINHINWYDQNNCRDGCNSCFIRNLYIDKLENEKQISKLQSEIEKLKRENGELNKLIDCPDFEDYNKHEYCEDNIKDEVDECLLCKSRKEGKK